MTMAEIENVVLAISGSVWILPILFGFTVIDGFFPPLPSESLIIALATFAAAGHPAPPLWGLFIVGMVGAWIGDQCAYNIGRWIDVTRFRFYQRPRVRAVFNYANRTLTHRGASIIFSARYIPVGRVAVNMTAGTLRYPYRRFALVGAGAAVVWSAYSIGIGLLAGTWINAGPLVNACIGIVGGLVIGALIDLAMSKRRATVMAEVDEGDKDDVASVEKH